MRLPPSDPESDGPNLTPVIDVVFLLLIFFLVATTFAEEERDMSVHLAEVGEAGPILTPAGEMILNISEAGEYKVGTRIFSEPELAALLEAQKLNIKRVQLRIDEQTPFRYPAVAISLCRQKELPHTCSVRLKRK
ncbi:MAG: biopolymer transporter ExbD [Planctomycetes bacterium]|nr:biopolymer transporter ExbD [Planctomycetota bacterium]